MHTVSRPPQPRDFPAGPLVRELSLRIPAYQGGVTPIMRTFAVNGLTARRWLNEGLTGPEADRAAVALNMHPAEIWGRTWPSRIPVRSRSDCGSDARYRAHLRAGEIACDKCKAAHARYVHARYLARGVTSHRHWPSAPTPLAPAVGV